MSAVTGRMPWPGAQARLASEGARCLWQDLDGLHLEPAPHQHPHTSILWAWTADHGTLWRIRLDGGEAFVACHHPDGTPGTPLMVWNDGPGGDGQVLQYRPASPESPSLSGLAFTQYLEAVTGGQVPVSFFALGEATPGTPGHP